MLEEKLKSLPDKPGVYLMKDAEGKIIYVGKAISLKSRVRSYFSSQHAGMPRTQALVRRISDLEYILTDGEIEALILESNLIKEYKPKYNVRLTDDKNYPFLRVSTQEDFPRLEIVRSRKRDGARYFGPYTNTGAVNETLRLLKKIFPIRSCKQPNFARRDRPCLNSHIARCAAPCCGQISKEDYRKMIEEILLFLDGRQEDLFKKLQSRMEEAAENLRFEKAAELRDQLQAIQSVVARQKIVSGKFVDIDALHYARSTKMTCVQIFFIREGKVLGRDRFFLEGTEDTTGEEILASFLKQYYSQVDYTPAEILLPEKLEEETVLENWLSEKRGAKVHLKVPKAGEKRALLELVGRNAAESLQMEAGALAAREHKGNEALEQVAAALNLDAKPQRIECYDISHIQGAETVASMVVFEQGRAAPAKYRRFKIRTVQGPDDFASMAEVIERRFTNALAGEEKFKELPDLVLIDGGKGQLSAACEAMGKLGFGHIPAAGLAKENEWLFIPASSMPVILPRNSQGLNLLQRIRDEAHRFAVTYHRLLRGRRNLASVLDEIPGVGPKRKKDLLKAFGMSLKKMMNASPAEIAEIEGINAELAKKIWEYFHPMETDNNGEGKEP
ncbi:MAG: excinuclease ABC subunit UvrC [Clostridia bacterium]|nr:excinuclease ABC subunit UvrC [Clostridia bacterium]